MKTGATTLRRMWCTMMESPEAPLARAASTKSRLRTWVVAVSEIRHSGGMNTSVSATKPFAMPPPMTPEIATASRTDGNA